MEYPFLTSTRPRVTSPRIKTLAFFTATGGLVPRRFARRAGKVRKMPYYEVVNPMNGKREQVRPVNEIAAEMDALDGQIAELSRQRDALAYEHEATANLLNYGLPKVF